MTQRPRLIGEIVEHDGYICLQTGAGCWYPLGGSSGIAERFRESFGDPQRVDIGKRLYNTNGVLQMENTEQMRERLGQ